MTDSRTPARRRVAPIALVLVLLLVGGLAGLISAVARGTVWTSDSQLRWDPSVRAELDPDYTTPDSTTFDRQVADQQDVVLSDAVVSRAASALDLSAAAVRQSIVVTTTAGSSVFRIGASASTPAQARRIATQVTTAYVDVLQAANEAELQARLNGLTPVIAELRRQLASANATAAAPLATNIAQLVSQQAEYRAAASDVPVEATVLNAAATPTSPSSLGPLVSLLIGAALGAVLGICILLLVGSRPRAVAALRQEAPLRSAEPQSSLAAAAAVAHRAPRTEPVAPAPAASAPAPAAHLEAEEAEEVDEGHIRPADAADRSGTTAPTASGT